jgi:hypothetical protein
MTKHQVELSLDQAILSLAGKSAAGFENQLKREKEKNAKLKLDLASLKAELTPLKKRVEKLEALKLSEQSVEENRKKRQRQGAILVREAGRVMKVLNALKEKKLSSYINHYSSWGAPRDLVLAKAALSKAVKDLDKKEKK